MQKLAAENSALGDEVRTAQENLRLSANTVMKLNNELKIVCNENEQLKRRIDQMARLIETRTKEAKYLADNNEDLKRKNLESGDLNKKLI